MPMLPGACQVPCKPTLAPGTRTSEQQMRLSWRCACCMRSSCSPEAGPAAAAATAGVRAATQTASQLEEAGGCETTAARAAAVSWQASWPRISRAAVCSLQKRTAAAMQRSTASRGNVVILVVCVMQSCSVVEASTTQVMGFLPQLAAC